MSKTPASAKKGDEVITRITKEEVFRDRCRNLKRKTSELEDENNRLLKKLKKAKRIVARLRLERSFLFDKLEQYESIGGAFLEKEAEPTAQTKPSGEKQPVKSTATKSKSSIKQESRNATPNAAGATKTRTLPKSKKPKATPTAEEKSENVSGAEDDVDLNKHLAKPAASTKAKGDAHSDNESDGHSTEGKGDRPQETKQD